ncbi:MAG TPA: DUF5654 family protein [Candidatus Magasanikbacteria bacterium]|nr:DUF5654 family protein [Candidatus Magasanikbacteria bacterium]
MEINKNELHNDLRRELREKTIGYIVAALGLVAGLAWNDAIKSVIEFFYPLNENTLWAKLVYAVLITGIIVLVSYFLLRLSKKDK